MLIYGDLNESIKKLRSVDFSLFARELMYINKELNIEKRKNV